MGLQYNDGISKKVREMMVEGSEHGGGATSLCFKIFT